MSRRERRTFTKEFKTKVAIEALRGDRKISEIAQAYDVMPPQVSLWKKMAKDAMLETFTASKRGRKPNREKVVAELRKRVRILEKELTKYHEGGSLDEGVLLGSFHRSLAFSDDSTSSADSHRPRSFPSFAATTHLSDDEQMREREDGFKTLALEEALDAQEGTIVQLRSELQRVQQAQASDRRALESLIARMDTLEVRSQGTPSLAKSLGASSSDAFQSISSNTMAKRSAREEKLGLSVRIAALGPNSPRCPACSESFTTNAPANSTLACPHCGQTMRWFQNRKEQWYTKTVSKAS